MHLCVVGMALREVKRKTTCLRSSQPQAMGVLRRLSSHRSGMRRKALLMIYKMYVPLLLEFGCVHFSGVPAYQLRPLVIIGARDFTVVLRPSKICGERSNIPGSRFNLLTVQTFLPLYKTLSKHHQIIFISNPDIFFSENWPRFSKQQIIFAQTLLGFLKVRIHDLRPLTTIIFRTT